MALLCYCGEFSILLAKKKKSSNWCLALRRQGDSCNINMVAYRASWNRTLQSRTSSLVGEEGGEGGYYRHTYAAC